MPPRRPLRFLIVALAIVALAPASFAETPALRVPVLEGTARDLGGRGLGEVQVFVSHLTSPGRPARATTDDDGRFLLRGLVPGLYRVTAVKTGYESATLRVNTLVRNTLDLVLRPADRPGPPGERPESLDWVLRLTSRDLLEDVDHEIALEEDLRSDEAASLRTVSWRPEVSGAVEQWYWAGTPFGDGELADERGLATSLEFASPLTSRSRMRVKGSRFQEDTAIPGDDGSLSEFLRHRVDIGSAVTTSSSSGLEVLAYFDRGDRTLPGPADAASPELSRGDEAAWGYDARWSAAVGAGSSVDVALGYHEARVDIEGEMAAAAYGTPAERLDSRTVSAAGAFTAAMGDHKMNIGLRARRFDAESADLHVLPAYGGAAEAAFGATEWDFVLSGGDEWRLSSLVTLSYGFDYRRAILDEPIAVLVPRAGLSFSPTPSTVVSSTVTWTARDAGWSAGTPSGEAERFGYRFVVEQGIGARNVVALSTERRPAGHGLAGADGGGLPLEAEEAILYIADPAADGRWWGGAWTMRFRGGSGSVGFERGEIEGRLAPRLAGDLPVIHLQPGTLAFEVARAEMRWDPSGTSLRLEVQAVEVPMSSMLPEEYDRVSLFLDQELPFLKVRDTRWRFLLAVQDTLGESDRANRDERDDGSALRPALVAAHRISGGIAVSF
jgi:hypothetical protein